MIASSLASGILFAGEGAGLPDKVESSVHNLELGAKGNLERGLTGAGELLEAAGTVAQGVLLFVGARGRTSSGALGQFRRSANIGKFSALNVPLQKRAVQRIARDAGVGLEGVKIKIVRDPELVGRGIFGHADPRGTITLYPDAFSDTETLVKTLGHERTHLMQFRLFGQPKDLLEAAANEKAALGIEETFWQFFQGNK